MKRIFALFLSLLLVVSLAGCGGAQQQNPSAPSEPAQVSGQTAAAPSENFVRIPGGTFQMGSPESEAWRVEDETAHTVTLSDYYISEFEVTQAEYQTVMGANPSSFIGDDLPVEGISWMDAINYCNARSTQEGLTPAYT
ncbi:MAG: formylglycine-generating enzyme family protein, partial [Oscillospiraceae bacterium]|nr:formylglycine-generating enzyme family protein [Oscillospiraceae bacterium]